MGLAMYNSIILDLNFPLCCFKKLLTPHTYSNPVYDDSGTYAHSKGDHLSVGPIMNAGVVKFSLDDLETLMPVSCSVLL